MQVLVSFCLGEADTLFKKAEKGSSDAPITITAQKVDFNNQEKEAVYSGDVKVIKGDITLTANTIRVLFYEADQGMKSIHASGQVKIWWKDRIAEAEEGIYDGKTQTIILTGSPRTWQQENMIRGDKITYDLESGKVLVEGGVETIIQMKAGTAGVVKP